MQEGKGGIKMKFVDTTRAVPLSEEEIKKWTDIPREEWLRVWYDERVPIENDPEWPNNVKPAKKDILPCHGEWMNIKGRDGNEIPVILYKPKTVREKTPVYFQIHGGGFCSGSALTNDNECTYYRDELDILVVSIDYRLAPEYPYPAGLHDCYDVVKYFVDHADEYHIDVDKMGVGGCSSGGCLATATCMLAIESGEFAFRYQMLLYPGINHYDVPQAADSAIKQQLMFVNCYCDYKTQAKDYHVSVNFAPDEILKQMPTTMILTCEMDDLNVPAEEYAMRIARNGVPTLLRRFPNAVHAFTLHWGAWDDDASPKALAYIVEGFKNYLI